MSKKIFIFLFLIFVLNLNAFSVEQPKVVKILYSENNFIEAEGWQTEFKLPANVPKFFVDKSVSHSGKGSLAIYGNNNEAEYGCWKYLVNGIEEGKWYRFEVYYKTSKVEFENYRVVPRIDWLNSKNKRAGQPDYVADCTEEGNWKKMTTVVEAPEGAQSAKLELYLGWSPEGTVWWDDVKFEEVTAPEPRRVRIATVKFRPVGNKTGEQNVEDFCELLEEIGKRGADIVCLPEGITVVGTGKTYSEVAEPVPGITSKRLGQMARKYNMYIIAGIYELENSAVYNTAILIDRKGEYIGKYRKVYIPREEIEGGITPGKELPVFETDFGKIGILICWDWRFPNAAHILAMKGAEIIFMPIWGGNITMVQSIPMANSLFLVTSFYSDNSYIFDPNSNVIAQATPENPFVIAEINLSKRYINAWLGEMKKRFKKEWRYDLK